MIKEIKRAMTQEELDALNARVLKMNTGIDDFIYNEMLNHKKWYMPSTGLRETKFACRSTGHRFYQFSIAGEDGTKIGVECITPNVVASEKLGNAVLYVHGAAFQRRITDINLHTAERLSTMLGMPVFAPDYRVGVAYKWEQMVGDVVACYKHMIWCDNYVPDCISVVADSSGCTTALFAIKAIAAEGMPLPKRIVLLSPQAWTDVSAEKLAKGKRNDPSMTGNNLFSTGEDIVKCDMARGKSIMDISPAAIDYRILQGCEVLIQTGSNEMFLEDGIELHDLMSKHCRCDMEVYLDMYHNFQTYYSICKMAHYSWGSMINFILYGFRDASSSSVNKLNLV